VFCEHRGEHTRNNVTKVDPALSALTFATSFSRHDGPLGEGKFRILPNGILVAALPVMGAHTTVKTEESAGQETSKLSETTEHKRCIRYLLCRRSSVQDGNLMGLA
jgi:hypothetical protein